MNGKIEKIIIEPLKNYFFNRSLYENMMTIFLCGGSKNEDGTLSKAGIFRNDIRKKISGLMSKFDYSVYYPEEMFDRLIHGPEQYDLLTLENLLANSVKTVVILLQTPGTFTELGAFTNYSILKDKLIVVIDEKYKDADSFINYGPVRYIKKTLSKVIFRPLETSYIDNIASKIVEDARIIEKQTILNYDLTNPIVSQDFCLALLYVLNPLTEKEFDSIAYNTNSNKFMLSESISAVKAILYEDKKILFINGELIVTPNGIESLKNKFSKKKHSPDLMTFLTTLRLEALNLTLRNK